MIIISLDTPEKVYAKESPFKSPLTRYFEAASPNSKANEAQAFCLFSEQPHVNYSQLNLEKEKKAIEAPQNVYYVYKKLQLHSLQDMKLFCKKNGLKDVGNREVVKKRIMQFLKTSFDIC